MRVEPLAHFSFEVSMFGINTKRFAEFINISNYSPLHKVYLKQMERQERVLTEIRDELIKHNEYHASAQSTQKPVKQSKPTKKKPKPRV